MSSKHLIGIHGWEHVLLICKLNFQGMATGY